jgi:hypothetical protein
MAATAQTDLGLFRPDVPDDLPAAWTCPTDGGEVEEWVSCPTCGERCWAQVARQRWADHLAGRTPTSMWWLGGGRCARCPTFPDDGSCTVAVTDSWAPPGDLTNAVEVADGDDVQGGGGDWWRCRALCACGWRHDTTSTAVAWRRAWEHLGQWDRIVHQPVLPPSAFDQDGSLRQPKKKDAGLAALLDSVDRTLPLLTILDPCHRQCLGGAWGVYDGLGPSHDCAGVRGPSQHDPGRVCACPCHADPGYQPAAQARVTYAAASERKAAIDAAGDEFDRAVRDLSAFCNRCAPVVMDGRWHWCARDPAHPGRCTCWCQWSVDCGHGHHGGCDGRDRVTADYHQEPDGTCWPRWPSTGSCYPSGAATTG